MLVRNSGLVVVSFVGSLFQHVFLSGVTVSSLLLTLTTSSSSHHCHQSLRVGQPKKKEDELYQLLA